MHTKRIPVLHDLKNKFILIIGIFFQKNVIRVGCKPILDSESIFEVLEAIKLDIFKDSCLNSCSHKI